MTDYQLNLIVTTYFNILIDRKINEKFVKDMYARQNILHIVLENGEIIKETIKNFY